MNNPRVTFYVVINKATDKLGKSTLVPVAGRVCVMYKDGTLTWELKKDLKLI